MLSNCFYVLWSQRGLFKDLEKPWCRRTSAICLPAGRCHCKDRSLQSWMSQLKCLVSVVFYFGFVQSAQLSFRSHFGPDKESWSRPSDGHDIPSNNMFLMDLFCASCIHCLRLFFVWRSLHAKTGTIPMRMINFLRQWLWLALWLSHFHCLLQPTPCTHATEGLWLRGSTKVHRYDTNHLKFV